MNLNFLHKSLPDVNEVLCLQIDYIQLWSTEESQILWLTELLCIHIQTTLYDSLYLNKQKNLSAVRPVGNLDELKLKTK